MVFSAKENLGPAAINRIKTTIMINPSSSSQQELALILQATLISSGYTGCEIVNFDEVLSNLNILDEFCISLLEYSGSILNCINEQHFEAFQPILTSGTNMLWVSGLRMGQEQPESGVLDGLARVLRTENPQLVFVTLCLECNDMCIQDHRAKIARVFEASISGIADGSFEREFVEKDGVLHISRIVEANYLNRHITSQLSPTQTSLQEFGHGPYLKLNVGSPGLLDSLIFMEDKRVEEALADNEIEIEVKAAGLNFMDLLGALGRLDTRNVIGSECAGIVTRTGKDADFTIGERVTMTYPDTLKSRVRCPYQCAVCIPAEMPFSVAAAIPTTFTTAYHALHEIARIQRGESILIHSAAGGTGQSAVQIAKSVGAEIFATVGSNDKKQLLIDQYDIADDHIFYSRNNSFLQGVKRMTQSRGVDVVLNSLAGDNLVASWECVAPYGRFIEIGKKDILSNEALPMLQFSKNITFSAVDMATMGDAKPYHIRRMLELIVGLVAKESLRPPWPLKTYGISEIEQAFRYMQSGKSVGKIVVMMDGRDQVKVSAFKVLWVRLMPE